MSEMASAHEKNMEFDRNKNLFLRREMFKENGGIYSRKLNEINRQIHYR
jgi:hypothetical protein